MVWLWVLSPVLIALAYLLAAPIYVEVDTTANLLRLRFHKLISAAVLVTGGSIFMDLKVAWWQKHIDLLARKKKIRTEKPKPARKIAKRKRVSFRTVLAILKTFKVTRFFLTVDTGDPVFNGIIYPAIYAVSFFTGQNVSVNFSERNVLILQAKDNLARILRAFIYSSLKKRTWKI